MWGYGNRTAMALLLTNDEEAILSKVLIDLSAVLIYHIPMRKRVQYGYQSFTEAGSYHL